MPGNRLFASASEDEAWISISDMMAGLMVVFLFIAITYIRPLVSEQATVRDIVVAFQETERELYDALQAEFENDLPRWGAELDRDTLSVRFHAPEVLFAPAQATLQPRYRAILADFFPRYLAVLERFADAIEEIRVEGHTSSEWAPGTPPMTAYFANMDLSQARTRAVLEHCLRLPAVLPAHRWAVARLTANGLSSSQAVFVNGAEDRARSRRVEFRVRTDAKERVVKVLEAIE